MNCPKCGSEMKIGALAPSGKGLLYWASDEFFKKQICNLYTKNGIKNAGGIAIHAGNGIIRERTTAWACKKCEMVLVDCSKK